MSLHLLLCRPCQQHLYGLASWPVYNPRSEIGHFKPENLHVRLHVLGLLVTSTAGHAVAVVTDDNRKLQVDTMKSGILFFIAAAFEKRRGEIEEERRTIMNDHI